MKQQNKSIGFVSGVMERSTRVMKQNAQLYQERLTMKRTAEISNMAAKQITDRKNDKLMTSEQVMERLQIKKRYFRELSARGELGPRVRTGLRNGVLHYESEVEAYIARNTEK